MKRSIEWNSGALDEIELVYEKAEQNETAGRILEQLEEKALAEVKENCALFKDREGRSLTSEAAEALPASTKEAVIRSLGASGIASMGQDIENAVLTVKMSPLVQTAMACTIFGLLNRLEKLDGALNKLYAPKWKLRLLVPVDGRKGLFQWEMLIMTLYPWLSVSDEADRDTQNASPAAPDTKSEPSARSASTPARTAAQPEPSAPEKSREKKSLLKRLFGK